MKYIVFLFLFLFLTHPLSSESIWQLRKEAMKVYKQKNLDKQTGRHVTEQEREYRKNKIILEEIEERVASYMKTGLNMQYIQSLDLKIPSYVGKVVKVWRNPDKGISDKYPVVFCIQDIHVQEVSHAIREYKLMKNRNDLKSYVSKNLEDRYRFTELKELQTAFKESKDLFDLFIRNRINRDWASQRNSAHMLEMLRRKNKTLDIYSEAYFDTSEEQLSWLYELGTPQELEAMRDTFNQGEIKAEEYVLLGSYGAGFNLIQIEDEAIHTLNMQMREKADALRDDIILYLYKIEEEIVRLKNEYYNRDLYQLDKSITDYKFGIKSLKQHVLYLYDNIFESDKLSYNFDALDKFQTLISLEDQIDFDDVFGMFDKLLVDLGKYINIDEYKMLTILALKLRNKEILRENYYSFVIDIAQRYPDVKIDSKVYQYLSYLESFSQLNYDQIGLEMESLENILKAKTMRNSNDNTRTVVQLEQWVQEEINFWGEYLTAEDWASYKKNASRTKDFPFVLHQLKRLGVNISKYSSLISIRDIEQLRDVQFEYYSIIEERDKLMIDFIIRDVKTSPLIQDKRDREVVAFVAGGFHTKGVTEGLKKNGINYVVFRPNFKSISDPNDKSGLRVKQLIDRWLMNLEQLDDVFPVAKKSHVLEKKILKHIQEN